MWRRGRGKLDAVRLRVDTRAQRRMHFVRLCQQHDTRNGVHHKHPRHDQERQPLAADGEQYAAQGRSCHHTDGNTERGLWGAREHGLAKHKYHTAACASYSANLCAALVRVLARE